MGSRVPPSLKKKVLEEWLQGFSRDFIAITNNIAAGTVTNIIKQSKDTVFDIDLLREVALTMRKGGVDLNHFATSIRLKNRLDELDLKEENFESFLDNMHLHCFRDGLSEKEFVSKIDELSKLVAGLGIQIYDIPSYIDQREKEIDRLEVAIVDQQKRAINEIRNYHTTKEDLEEFKASKPLLSKIDELEDDMLFRDETIYSQRQRMLDYQLEIHMNDYSRSIPEVELDKANELLLEEGEPLGKSIKLLSEEGEPLNMEEWSSGQLPLDMDELSALSDEIYQHPSRNIDIIKLLRLSRQSRLGS